MKSVLAVCDYGSPYRGNFIESLENLRAHLNVRGAQLIYFLPVRAAKSCVDWTKTLKDDGATVCFSTGSIFKDAALIKKIIKTHDVGIVHIHFRNYKHDLAAWLGCMGTGVKKIKHFHNHTDAPSGLKGKLLLLTMRGSTLLGVSGSVTENLKQVFPGFRCECAENAIYFNRLDSFETLKRSDYGFHDDSTVCMMMGFDFLRKGVDLAVKAIDALRRESGADIRLMLLLTKNEDVVREKIARIFGTFPDWIAVVPPRGDIASYYHIADIFISASREEGFCYALVEAAYCGLIPVASKIPAQGDLNIPQCFWFESGSTEALKEALARATGQIGVFNSHADINRHSVTKIYGLDQWSDRLMNLYDNLGAR